MIPFIVNHLLDELKFKPPILHHVHFPRNGLGWEMINAVPPSPPRLGSTIDCQNSVSCSGRGGQWRVARLGPGGGADSGFRHDIDIVNVKNTQYKKKAPSSAFYLL